MSGYPADQVLSPPDLPPYLDSVCKLSPIVGVPKDDQVIEIHTTIRVANRVVDRKLYFINSGFIFNQLYLFSAGHG